MKKILKCVLAFALLSMVFTSTAFAEGSVTDDITVGGVATSVADIDGTTYEGNQKDLVKGVNGKATIAGVKVTDLAEETKVALANAGVVITENTVMTPFYEISGSGAGSFSVNLGASLLGSAKGVSAVHVKGDGSVEVIGASSFDKTAGTATFTVSSFSPFAFVIEVEPAYVYVPSKPAKKDPVVNTAAGEVNHTNYMAYAAVASVLAVGAIVIASKKLAKNAK